MQTDSQASMPPTPAPYTPRGGFNWRQLIYFLTVGIVAAGLSGVLVWGYMSNQNNTNTENLKSQISAKDKTITTLQKGITVAPPATSPATSTLTNDQIFAEVSSQFNLKRSDFIYFRIYSQDKVTFGAKIPGSNHAYKQGGTWHKTDEVGRMDVPICSTYSNVPEAYKPVCMVSGAADAHTAYLNSTDGEVNYPESSRISYIGQ